MNKNDISDQTKVTTLKSIMRMDDILQKSPCRYADSTAALEHCRGSLTPSRCVWYCLVWFSTAVVHVSALTGMNFDTLLKLIVKLGAAVKGQES